MLIGSLLEDLRRIHEALASEAYGLRELLAVAALFADVNREGQVLDAAVGVGHHDSVDPSASALHPG